MTASTGQSAATDQVASITDRLRAEADAVQAAFAQRRSDEDAAWRRCTADARASLSQMQGEMDAAQARMADQRLPSRADLRHDLDAVFGRLREVYDHLSVQVRFGEMDGADLVSVARSEAFEILDRGRAAAREARRALAEPLL